MERLPVMASAMAEAIELILCPKRTKWQIFKDWLGISVLILVILGILVGTGLGIGYLLFHK